MTLTIEVAPHIQRRLEAKARRDGQTLDAYVTRVVERDALEQEPIEEAAAPMSEEQRAEVARKLALIAALPTTNNRAGLPELDLSGSRADVYGYTEREDAQL